MGIAPASYSRIAISIGSMMASSFSSTRTGEPMLICRARAPIILALSNLVYLKDSSSAELTPKMWPLYIRLGCPANSGLTGEEPGRRTDDEEWFAGTDDAAAPPEWSKSYDTRIQGFVFG
ncbi:MAG: hypothetical protein QG582_998 [Candidatus Thermoplasmatota archaeon]|nr:hypothetical protein [Candidatus Thermoplasmatota archaeon]